MNTEANYICVTNMKPTANIFNKQARIREAIEY